MGASSGDACVSQYTKLGNFQATGGSNAPSIQSGQRPPPPPPFGLGGNSSTGNNGIPEELQSYDTNQDGKIAGGHEVSPEEGLHPVFGGYRFMRDLVCANLRAAHGNAVVTGRHD